MSKPYVAYRRFFAALSAPPQQLPYELTLTDTLSVHHARNVLRLKPGETVILVDTAQETGYYATLASLDKRSMRLRLDEALPGLSAALPPITLGAALLKEQRWDLLLQKTTELGVRTLAPLASAHCVVRVHDPEKKQARWQSVVQSAAEQSEGLFIPRVEEPRSLEAFCQAVETLPLKLLLLERGERPTMKVALLPYVAQPPAGIALAIGPEGGWSDAEIDLFAARGFQAVSLGDRILRSETAAMAAISALIYEFG